MPYIPDTNEILWFIAASNCEKRVGATVGKWFDDFFAIPRVPEQDCFIFVTHIWRSPLRALRCATPHMHTIAIRVWAVCDGVQWQNCRNLGAVVVVVADVVQVQSVLDCPVSMCVVRMVFGIDETQPSACDNSHSRANSKWESVSSFDVNGKHSYPEYHQYRALNNI